MSHESYIQLGRDGEENQRLPGQKFDLAFNDVKNSTLRSYHKATLIEWSLH